jgi:hypothetical protein
MRTGIIRANIDAFYAMARGTLVRVILSIDTASYNLLY